MASIIFMDSKRIQHEIVDFCWKGLFVFAADLNIVEANIHGDYMRGDIPLTWLVPKAKVV